MELTTAEQVAGLIQKSNTILIALPAKASLDSVAGGLALRQYLINAGKKVEVVTSGIMPRQLGFLAGVDSVLAQVKPTGLLTVTLNTSRTKLGELSYETKNDSVRIFLQAKEGAFSAADVSIETASVQFDSIIILGSESFESLGDVFTENAELFYNTPKINIDINPNNEYFGTINVVDVTASAVSEVLFSLFSRLGMGEVSEDIATALLAGITVNTNSFQGIHTTPNSLIAASELIGLGARQQDVVRHLFKTKELSLLKLWGRALARLKANDEYKFVYTAVNGSDFEKTESDISYIPLVLQEFIDNVSGFKVFGVLAETDGSVDIAVTLHPQLQTSSFLDQLGVSGVTPLRLASGTEYLHVRLPGSSLLEAEQRFVQALQQSLPTKSA
jgi:nanoRNase/pAp phosphatase (c-di-AMP/oligoRNAs hydrolase)